MSNKVPTSQNGWAVHPDQKNLAILSWVTGRVVPGDVHKIFDYICTRFHNEVEPIVRKESWGWAYRPVRGKTTGFSNHASGTAIDLNAPKHPIGVRNTFTPAQKKKIKDIVASTKGAVRWGGDYVNRPDEMHFEINTNSARLREVVKEVVGNSGNSIERFLKDMDEKKLRDIVRSEAQEAVARELWRPVVSDYDGIPGSSWRNNMLHQTNAAMQSLALLRALMEGQGIKVDMEKMTKDFLEAVIPVLTSTLSEEVGEEAAKRTVDKLAKKLSRN